MKIFKSRDEQRKEERVFLFWFWMKGSESMSGRVRRKPSKKLGDFLFNSFHSNKKNVSYFCWGISLFLFKNQKLHIKG